VEDPFHQIEAEESAFLSIAVLIACHNRRAKTLACLEQLDSQSHSGFSFQLNTFVVDDGSTDGTSDAISARFPATSVISGSGSLYWNGAMRLAFSRAAASRPDFFLLLNDDTHIKENAVVTLLDTFRAICRSDGAGIVVGAIYDAETNQMTYGGEVTESRWFPLRLKRLMPTQCPARCHTFNGNCVLISRRTYELVGSLERRFSHRFGDIDYGLRASRVGIPVYLAPGFLGTCSIDHHREPHLLPDMTLRERMSALCNLKYLPPKEWFVMCRRHGGPLWPVLVVAPYAKTLISHVISKVRPRSPA
jgi:GT2 family glycosyltransferase